MRFKTLATALATVVLSTVLAPIAVSAPAQAQTQTSWHVNDSPTLFGPNQYWYWGDPGHGYGSNYYRYTYAIGGESTADNWARWNMGSRVGRQEIQVYVPSNHATATVNYNITIGGSTYKQAVAQRNISGWHSLGNWNTNGSEVVIAVYDNDATQHRDRDGFRASRIGVDAIRMRCVSNCGSTPPTTTTTQPPVGGPPDPPRLSVRIDESAGGRTLVASWSPPSDDGGSRITGYTVTVSRLGRTFGPYDRPASSRSYRLTNARENTTYTVRVVAENAHGRSRAATASAMSQGEPPGSPRNVRWRETTVDGEPRIVASWSPPSDDGGSRITGYTVTISRPGRTFGPYPHSASNRSRFIRNPRSETTYTVRVSAQNRHGSSRTVAKSISTPGYCPSGGKFRIDDGIGTDPPYALQEFVVTTGVDENTGERRTGRIRPDTKGGELNLEASLSQSGCSWVFEGADVINSARVSGNAVVLRGAKVAENAQVYGNAVVMGSSTRVTGNARVHGNAVISGGAKIKGSADISGEVRVRGGEISEGTFDGITEYIRALKAVYAAAFLEIVKHLRGCQAYKNEHIAVIREEVRSLFNLGGPQRHRGSVSEAKLIGCVQHGLLGRIVLAALPDWTSYLPFGGDAAVTLTRLSKVAGDLNTAERLLAMIDEVRDLYSDISASSLCRQTCPTELLDLRRTTYS